VTFFERQPEKPQPVPQAADADLDLALGQQPPLQFLDRRVGMLADMRAKVCHSAGNSTPNGAGAFGLAQSPGSVNSSASSSLEAWTKSLIGWPA
jgi:hypothetical protein